MSHEIMTSDTAKEKRPERDFKKSTQNEFPSKQHGRVSNRAIPRYLGLDRIDENAVDDHTGAESPSRRE